MMYYLEISVLVLACLYIGQIAGLAIQCDNCELLRPAKRYVYIVPVLSLIVSFSCIKESLEKNKWDEVKFYIICPHKNLMCLQAIADFAVVNLAKKKSRRKNIRISSSQFTSIRRGAESFLISNSKQYSTYS